MTCRVRTARESLGLTQAALARRVGVSRQALAAIEAGRAVPSVAIALRMAKVLGARVEALFGEEADGGSVEAEGPPAAVGSRVALAEVWGRWVQVPLDGEGVRLSADGLVAGSREFRSTISTVRSLQEARRNVVVMGCAAGLALLADRLNACGGSGRFLWFASSSVAALEGLAGGRAHVAGVHLVDPATGDVNVTDVRRALGTHHVSLFTLARWEAGLVTRPEDAPRVQAVASLARPGLRLAVREHGAGARRLLEGELARAGVSLSLDAPPHVQVRGHLEVARAVAMGAADAGVASCDAARAFGLRFVPLAAERYDLVVPAGFLGDARLERLLDALNTSPVRRELAALGYDTTSTGAEVALDAA